MSRFGAAASWLGQVLSWVVILGVSAVLCATVLVPRVAGATPYTILTGSMRPGLPPGTLVVVKPVDAGEIRIGNVVTYQLQSGEPEVVTHRVVGVGTHKGEPVYRTKGDANNVVDQDSVRHVQVRGRLWYSVPYLGRVNTWLTRDQRQLGVYLVGGGLLLYAGYMFTSAIRDRRTRSKLEEEDNS